MGTLAAIVGAIGGLCAVIGIITAAKVIPLISDEFTWMFWFVLSALLLLGSIALGLSRGDDLE